MQRTYLLGDYNLHEWKPCDFEDIPVFMTMADDFKQKQESKHFFSDLSNVKIKYVKSGETIILDSRIVRWRSVLNARPTAIASDYKYILAYRTRIWQEPTPVIYEVNAVSIPIKSGPCKGGEIFPTIQLCNVTSKYTKLQRLQMYYDAYPLKE